MRMALKKEKKRCEKKGKLDEVAQHCNAIGDEYAKLGLYDEAIEEHEEELGLCEALADLLGVAIANRKLGECLAEKGNFTTAFNYINRYLEISQCEGNTIEEQRAFATLGRTYYMQVDSLKDDISLKKCLKDAETAYRNSLEVCERLKPSTKEEVYMEMRARLLLNLGLVYEQKNEIDLCAQHLKEAIKITEKYKLHTDRYRCNITLASIYQRNTSYQKALHFYELALKCAQQTKDKSQQVEVFTQKALIHLQQDNLASCRKCLQKAYKVRTGNEEEKLKVVSDLKAAVRLERCHEQLASGAGTEGTSEMKLHEKCGDATAHLGAYEKALTHYKNMLACGERLCVAKTCLIPAYLSLAQTYQDLKDYRSAIEYYKKEVQCIGEDYSQIAKSYMNMAECYDKTGTGFDQIKEVYELAFRFASKARSTKLQRQVLLDQAEMEKHFHKEQSLKVTQQKLIEFGLDVSDEEEDSQETVVSDDSDIDLRDLTSSEDDTGEEEYDRSHGLVGVVRRVSYKVKKNEKGETELHVASIHGNLNRVKSLVGRGHPVNERDCAGWLPIHEACNHGWSKVVEFLLSKGAFVNDQGGTHCDGTTPLLDVCGVACAKVDCKKAAEAATYIRRHLDIIYMLVKSGANVHAKDMEGNTASDLLILQRKINLKELTREEIGEVRKTERFLKAVMEGNNPHLAEDSLPSVEYSDTEEEDSLPLLTSGRKHRSRVQNGIIDEESQDTELSEDCETDSERVSPVNTTVAVADELCVLKEHPEKAPLAYRAAIKDIGRSAAAHTPGLPNIRPQRNKVSTRALLTSEEYVGENWLEDDLGMCKKSTGKRKRRDPLGVFSTSGTRRHCRDSDMSSGEEDSGAKGKKRPKKKVNETSESETECESETTLCATDRDFLSGDNDILGSCTVPSASSGFHTSQTDTGSDVNGKFQGIIKKSLDARKENKTQLGVSCSSNLNLQADLDAHFDIIDTSSDLDIESLSVPHHKSKAPLSFFPTQSKNSSFQPKKSQQLKITNFSTKMSSSQHKVNAVIKNTPTNPNDMTSAVSVPGYPRGPVMRLRVKVKDKQILVPVPHMVEPPTVGWLAKETSNRYYQLCNLRPVLSITTKDGAIFSPDDLLLDLVTNNDELDSIIERWDLPPISHRYVDACKALKTVVYTNIKTLLHQSSVSSKLALEQLSLKSPHFLPVTRALQCHSSLKCLLLSGNKIGDEGVKDLVKILPTLSGLSQLDLSCNQITCNGVKALADAVDSSGTGDKPIQALESLCLSYNSLGDSCTLSIGRLVSHLPALTYLKMAACDLTVHFFQQNRITLAQAIKGATIQEVDMSHNPLGSTGVELLLISLRPDSLCRLNLTGTVQGGPSSNNLTKHVERYLKQEGVVLQDIHLNSCHLMSEAISDLCRCLDVNTTLRSLSLNNNKRLTLLDLVHVLQASVTSLHGHLENLQCVGCGLVAPLSTEFLDALMDKLDHASPLRSLELTVEGLSKMDVDALVQEVWKGKWGPSGMSAAKGNLVKLWVKDEY